MLIPSGKMIPNFLALHAVFIDESQFLSGMAGTACGAVRAAFNGDRTGARNCLPTCHELLL
jgi:hypothetical protein